MKSFSQFIRENYKVGDKVRYNYALHIVNAVDGDTLHLRQARYDRIHPYKVSAKMSDVQPHVAAKEQRSTDKGIRTCQVCERGIKLTGDVLAHHGYMRPGDGQQTSSCEGARELPFEVSRDVLGRHINSLHDSLKYHKDEEHKHLSSNGMISVPTKTKNPKKSVWDEDTYTYWVKEFAPDHPEYKKVKSKIIDNHRKQQSAISASIEHQQKRHDNWKPKKD